MMTRHLIFTRNMGLQLDAKSFIVFGIYSMVDLTIYSPEAREYFGRILDLMGVEHN